MERWGGWCVSGEHGAQSYLGNQVFGADGKATPLAGETASNLRDLNLHANPFDYLSPTSDIASLMVLEHQTRMTNLIVRLGFEGRRISPATSRRRARGIAAAVPRGNSGWTDG